MPSWNIHTAHVERLLEGGAADALGIEDANAFLFGNYVPDTYLGFMVADTTYRIDYCLTHLAVPDVTPAPDADRFWDECVSHRIRRPSTPEGMSLALGAWAHLVADRMYNLRFRAFCATHDTPEGDELRRLKQADFDLFGRALAISSHVRTTPSLLEAARRFRPYSVLADDVARTVEVASRIVGASGADDGTGGMAGTGDGVVNVAGDGRGWQLLSASWMSDAFDACNRRLATWLRAWQELVCAGDPCTAADVRAHAGLPPAGSDGLG